MRVSCEEVCGVVVYGFVYEEYDYQASGGYVTWAYYKHFSRAPNGAMQPVSGLLYIFNRRLLVGSSPIMIVNKE